MRDALNDIDSGSEDESVGRFSRLSRFSVASTKPDPEEEKAWYKQKQPWQINTNKPVDYYEPHLDDSKDEQPGNRYDRFNKQLRCPCAFRYPRHAYSERKIYPLTLERELTHRSSTQSD